MPLKDPLVTASFIAGWRAVRLLPERTAQGLFTAMADRLYARNGRGVQQLRENLAIAAPGAELDQLTHDGVRSYLRYWCEAFRLPSWPIDDLIARTTVVGEDNVRSAYNGPGAIVALPHTANWDWAGAWTSATGMPVLAVAERLRPTRVYDEFVAFRESIGMEIIPLDGEDTMPSLVDGLARKRLVCLLSDRAMSRTGIEVELLGQRARVPSGAAVLSQRTGAAVIPASFAYVGRDIELTFHPPVEIGDAKQMMQTVADAFTSGIREHPQDWHMMQKVFV